MLETVILGAVIVLILFLYLYFQTVYQYWVRKGLPQPIPKPLVGNVSEAVFKTKNMGLIYNDIYWKYREHDAVGFYQFMSPKLLLIKPSLFKQVLISEFSSFHDNEIYASEKMDPYLKTNAFLLRGDKWKPARTKLTHGLTTNKMREIYLLISECTRYLDSYITNHVGQDIEGTIPSDHVAQLKKTHKYKNINKTIDKHTRDLSSLFIMTTVSNSVFGIDSNCFTDPNAKFRQLINLLHREYWTYWWQTMLVFYVPTLRDLLGYSFVPRKISTFMLDMVRNVADARKKNNIKRNDYFQSYFSKDKPNEENVLDMVNNGMVFILAGTETSALVSANTLYALALTPDIQENLYQELHEAHTHKSLLSYETLIGLPYLEKVVQESLRRFPVAYASTKVCTHTTVMEIDGKDVKIEAGTKVMIPTFAVHHDPEYYPDPDVFDPERFSEDNKTARPECTYLPWGEGPRICAGKKFAETQIKVYLSHIVYRYRILPTERTPSKLTYDNFAFLVTPSEQIWIRLEKRE